MLFSYLALPLVAKMIRLELTDQDLTDVAEALDDPATTDKNKTKLLVIRMPHEGAKHGFIAKVLNLHANTITNYGPPSGWLDGFAYFWRVTGASRQLQARKKAALRFHYRISF